MTEPRITPILEDGELPLCSISCPESSNQYDKGHMYLDGAQCRVTGAACETLCEPAVRRMAQRLEAAEAVIGPLDRLRADEGNSVTIMCPNPSFDGPSQAIEVNADWRGAWATRRFEGDTVAECLKAAEAAKEGEK